MKLAIIGTGYVGLPTGACFADLGNDVVCVDNCSEKIESLNNDTIPLYEPGLAELIQRNRQAKRLRFTTDLQSAVSKVDIVVLAVGTPTDTKTGHADLSFINNAATELAGVLKPEDDYTVIAVKSTVPVGTNDLLAALIAKQNPHIQFDVASIPEFLREGRAIYDFLHPDRVVIGVEQARAKSMLEELYAPFATENIPIVYCNRKSAEMIKYAANAFLGIKISYTNELADLCEQLGGDIRAVAKGVGLDSRIGAKFLNPGPGFGGSCFPKDMLEFVTTAKEAGVQFSTVQAAIDYNLRRGTVIVNKIRTILDGTVSRKNIGILGLAYKAETDDVRMSPAIPIIKQLLAEGARIQAYDAQAMQNMRTLFSDISYASDPYAAAKHADVLVIITEWIEFTQLDFGKIKTLMKHSVVIDLRNILDPKAIVDAGFSYHPIGFMASN